MDRMAVEPSEKRSAHFVVRRVFVTTRQVAAQLNVSPRTVCLWAEAGEIPAVRVGRQWRFPSDRLNLWIQRRSSGMFPKEAGALTR